MRIESYLEELARGAIRDVVGTDAPGLVRATTDAKHGDYQVNGVLPLAKAQKRNPREIAGPVAEALQKHEAIASAEVAGPGFVNLRLADGWIAARLGEALADRERDGVPPAEAREKIVVDFSSPNIAKQMHVGHLRSTIIGDAIVRLLRFQGHEVIGDNHLGDWGTQFGTLIVGMRRWGDEAALAARPIDELERVYKLATAAAKDDPTVAETARAELAKLQAGDPENRALWQRFVAATRRELDAMYTRLGVSFEEWLGESAYEEMLPAVVGMLRERGIAREDQGALCVFFNELEGAPDDLKKQKEPFIVQKKDGAFLYSTTDIATILYRRDRWNPHRAIYVVDHRQALHFKQLFAVVRMLGVEMKLEHVGFGTILGTDGKPLKTRDGTPVTLASLLGEAVERADAFVREKVAAGTLRVPMDEIAEVAKAVGVGSVKYADLRQNRTSDYQFDWAKMISLSGNAAPYLQYAHARTRNIFVHGGVDFAGFTAPVRLEHADEAALGRRLLAFGDAVHAAANQSLPHLLCDHLYDLAGAFMRFYESCPVLKADAPLRDSRLALTALTARQLARGLTLLGITPLERM